MNPTRIIIRALGFFLIPLTIILVTYPLLQRGIREGKHRFLTFHYTKEDLKQMSAKDGILGALPVRLYFAQVYRSCDSDQKRLCPQFTTSEDITLCLTSKRIDISEADCREWFEEQDDVQ
ncbi:MAG: hypothetical protein KDD64_09590 [Bdellovibrionales bacterium]|nr:hypothetical protein [Bdellovibrionales bacterium]